MLPLIKVSDTVRLVCSTDPSVKTKKGADGVPSWMVASSVRHGKDALVVSVRPLSASELLRC